jgi:hypothetical protein
MTDPKTSRWTTWRRRPTPAFLTALIVGGSPPNLADNKNRAGDLADHEEAELQLVVDEGRRQLDAQSTRFADVQGRAQTLLTISLVVLGLTAGIVSRLRSVDGWRGRVEWVLWSIAIALDLLGVLLSAAVIAVRARFETTDTMQVTSMARPLLKSLADDYAKSVRLGEETVADRVNAFQVATRYTVWGAVMTALVFVATAV